MAQISEFSLILAALGMSLGHIDARVMGLIALVGLITISASTYMIIYSHPLYERLEPWLRVFESYRPYGEKDLTLALEDEGSEVILFGLGRYGSEIDRALRNRGCRVRGVDFNPELARSKSRAGHTVQYGDATDPEFVASLPLARTQWLVSTIRERDVNQTLIHILGSLGFDGRIAVTAYDKAEAGELGKTGAALILFPYVDAAEEAADQLMPRSLSDE